MRYIALPILLLCIFCSCNKESSPTPTSSPSTPTPTMTPDPHETMVTVPDDYATIQLAIDQTESGDTVVVKPGTYTENINFNGKNILLTSQFYETKDLSYISSTIIDGSQPNNVALGAVVQFNSRETAKAILQGFTITGGTGSIYQRPAPASNFARGGGGILVVESNPTIRYNYIENNEAVNTEGANSAAGGGGIRVELGAPTIQNNIIRKNTGGFAGGLFIDVSSARIINNLIIENVATKRDFEGGGGLYSRLLLISLPSKLLK